MKYSAARRLLPFRRYSTTTQSPTIKEVIYNKTLGYHLYIHDHGSPYESNPFSLSLCHNPQNRKAIFAWSQSDDPAFLYKNVIESSEFMKFFHDTIAGSPSILLYLLQPKARALGEGWIHLVDDRAMSVFGRTPDSDDIIGMVRADDGILDPATYTPMPTYRLVSSLGIVSLPKPLHKELLNKLESK